MKKNLEIYYDKDADILELQIGEPTECYYDEVDNDLFEGHDKKTGELKGYKIFNISKRPSLEGLKKIKIHLPANVEITSA